MSKVKEGMLSKLGLVVNIANVLISFSYFYNHFEYENPFSVRVFFVYFGKFMFTYQIRFDQKTVIEKKTQVFIHAGRVMTVWL